MDPSTPDPALLTHKLDELVVDLDHLDTVEGMLADLRVTHQEPITDDALGLGLLRGLTGADHGVVAVDDLLVLLRAQAACERDGWVPTVGKNRMLPGIIGDDVEGVSPSLAVQGGLAALSHKPMSHKPMSHKPMSPDLLSHKPMDLPQPVPADGPLEPPPGDPEAGTGVRVGMIDTSVEPPTGTAGVSYRAGHGMFVHSLIARQAPRATILPRAVLDPAVGRAEDWDVARAMVALAREGAHVVNVSLGSFTLAGGPPLITRRAVERLGPDVLLVAAAGNHGDLVGLVGDRTPRSACWPAAIPPCVAVGSHDRDGARPPFSPNLRWVRCSALGQGVVGDYLTGAVALPDGTTPTFEGRASWAGTSFSAATVSGAVAARMRPGSVGPRQALEELLAESGLVKPFVPTP